MYSPKELISEIVTWKNERIIIREQNKRQIANGEAFKQGGLFLGEVEEFQEALEDVQSGKGEDVDVASELSDIIFLCVSALDHYGEEALRQLESAMQISKSLERKSMSELSQVWNVAVLHLLRKAQELPEKTTEEVWDTLTKMAQLSTIGLFAYGFEPMEAVRGKLQRNREKYPTELFQSGSYEEKTQLAKRIWEPQKPLENRKYVGDARLPSKQHHR